MELFAGHSLGRFDIILASGSPRRRELLQQAGLPFRTLVRPVSEEIPEGMTPIEAVKHLSAEKSRMFDPECDKPETVVITADTIVVCDGIILNKPASEPEAFDMLRHLSGRWHEVHTGVCIRKQLRVTVFHETTRVHFRDLSNEEINHYVYRYQPFDKAGGYGIQEWIGIVGIDSIEGSYTNVVGLPVHRVYEELMKLLHADH